jgi:DNA adenine methylase
VRLAGRLALIEGRFILSVNDVSEMREVFARFSIESVSTRYSGKGNCTTDLRIPPQCVLAPFLE